MLKQCGFTFDLEASDGWFPLNMMCSVTLESARWLSVQCIRTLVEIFIKLGADVCAADYDGHQPLHRVFVPIWHKQDTHNAVELATVLLQNGADPCALSHNGFSPYDHAKIRGCTEEWFEALERAGFDIGEVQIETERRQRCYHNPDYGFAETTAVDDHQIAPPSTEGLKLRRAVPGDRLED